MFALAGIQQVVLGAIAIGGGIDEQKAPFQFLPARRVDARRPPHRDARRRFVGEGIGGPSATSMQAATTPTTRSAVIRPAYLTGPQFAAYLFAGIIALSFGHDLMRKPIQVSDSLQELLDVQQSPSLGATARAHSPRGPFLRPIRQVQIKMLFDLADGRYQLAFRGFHAMLVALALFLFVRALQVRTWADVARRCSR